MAKPRLIILIRHAQSEGNSKSETRTPIFSPLALAHNYRSLT